MNTKALKSQARSVERVLKERREVAARLGDRDTRIAIKDVVKPNSISKTLRKTGVALLIAPDPVTDVAGAILLGASLATRGKDPISPSDLFAESKRLLAELDSFT